jgi:transcriptional regulator with GAF, ATPase, and Fis domain
VNVKAEIEKLRFLYDLGCALAARHDVEGLVATAIARCRELIDAESVAVLLLDEQSNELYFPYSTGSDPALAGRLAAVRFPADRGVAGAVLREERSRLVRDTSTEPDFYPEVDRTTGIETRSMLAVPLLASRGALGVIEAVNPLGKTEFDREDLSLLESLAGSLALALDNAQMVAELRDRERRLEQEVAVLRRDLARRDEFSEIVGTGPAMSKVFRLMESAVASPISVLIQGETGTGKELIARAIHRASGRGSEALVAVNCGALPADLLESELFGHARGAFTGASAEQRGLFEAAHRGTMFLDEVGDLPPAMQVKLLRVLQDGEIMPLGTTKARRVDVRLIAATNRDLRTAVDAGEFRADLYYRIAAFPIPVPPLREHREDIPFLVEQFVVSACQRHGAKRLGRIELETIEMLSRYDWPGNVRQLRNEIERAVALTSEGEPLATETFSDTVRGLDGTGSRGPDVDRAVRPDATLREARDAFEARYISAALGRHEGNVSRTAESLGISRVMLQRKLKDLKLR